MHYMLIGFSQENEIRRFNFERVAGNGAHTKFTVAADLVMLRGFKIQVQDLPLLCCRLLEAQPEDTDLRALTLTEHDMRLHVDALVAAAAKRSPKGDTILKS